MPSTSTSTSSRSGHAAPGPRLCLVRLSALGDVCLVVPLLRELQRSWPEAQITWVIGREALPVVKGITGVRWVPFDKRGGWREYVRVGQELRSESFDALLALQASWRANWLYPWIRAKRKIGFDARRARDGHRWFVSESIPPAREHFVDAYLSFAGQLGITPGPVRWEIPIAPGEATFARETLSALSGSGPCVALNPAASKSGRNWPVMRYAEMMRRATQRWGVRWVMTGGPGGGERVLADDILSRVTDVPVLDLVGRTTVPQLFACLGQVDVLVSPDTGPAHFATAMGTPVVGLYGVVPSALSGPYHSQHLTVDAFGAAAVKYLGRTPDQVPWNTRIHSAQVMELITVEAVLEKLELALEERKSSLATAVPLAVRE